MGACASLGQTDSPQVSPARVKRSLRKTQQHQSIKEETPPECSRDKDTDSLLLPSVVFARDLSSISPLPDWSQNKSSAAPDAETGEISRVPFRFSTLSDSSESTISDITNPRNSLVLLEERIALREEFFRTQRKVLAEINTAKAMDAAMKEDSIQTPFMQNEGQPMAGLNGVVSIQPEELRRNNDLNENPNDAPVCVDIKETIAAPVVIPTNAAPPPSVKCNQSDSVNSSETGVPEEEMQDSLMNLTHPLSVVDGSFNATISSVTEEAPAIIEAGDLNATRESEPSVHPGTNDCDAHAQCLTQEPGDMCDDTYQSGTATDLASIPPNNASVFIINHNTTETLPITESETTVCDQNDENHENKEEDHIMTLGKELVEEGKAIQQQLADIMALQKQIEERENSLVGNTRQEISKETEAELNEDECPSSLKEECADTNLEEQKHTHVEPSSERPEDLSALSPSDRVKKLLEEGRRLKEAIAKLGEDESPEPEMSNEMAAPETDQNEAEHKDASHISTLPGLPVQEKENVLQDVDMAATEEGYDSDALLDEYNMVTYDDVDYDVEQQEECDITNGEKNTGAKEGNADRQGSQETPPTETIAGGEQGNEWENNTSEKHVDVSNVESGRQFSEDSAEMTTVIPQDASNDDTNIKCREERTEGKATQESTTDKVSVPTGEECTADLQDNITPQTEVLKDSPTPPISSTDETSTDAPSEQNNVETRAQTATVPTEHDNVDNRVETPDVPSGKYKLETRVQTANKATNTDYDPTDLLNSAYAKPMNADAKFKIYSLAMKLQQEMARMQLQLSSLTSQVRNTDGALQTLMDLVIDEMNQSD